MFMHNWFFFQSFDFIPRNKNKWIKIFQLYMTEKEFEVIIYMTVLISKENSFNSLILYSNHALFLMNTFGSTFMKVWRSKTVGEVSNLTTCKPYIHFWWFTFLSVGAGAGAGAECRIFWNAAPGAGAGAGAEKKKYGTATLIETNFKNSEHAMNHSYISRDLEMN